MIDTTKEYWTGSEPSDIIEYLRAYSEDNALDVKPVQCRACGCKELRMVGDRDEGALQVVCTSCDAKKLLLDSAEYWKEVSHRTLKCPICKNKEHDIFVGFSRRDNGHVKWVYIGHRCTHCHVLGSAFDWEINYEPTNDMEKNI